MKVCVCVKAVPRSSGPPSPDEVVAGISRPRVEMNAPDAHAIEAALRLRDEGDDGEVVLVSIAPLEALDSLRQGLAMGADRAVVVCDDAIRGSDVLATSRVLARVLEREAPRLVVFGWEAVDTNGGLLWAAVAERMGWPVISRAWRFEMRGPTISVVRQMEDGFDHAECQLPCLLALSGPVNVPRYPTLKSIITAKRKDIERPTITDIGIGTDQVGLAGSGTTVVGAAAVTSRRARRLVTDEGQGAAAILRFLADEGIVS